MSHRGQLDRARGDEPQWVLTVARSVSASQDGLLTRRQALAVLSEDELMSRLGRHWLVVLPGVYLTEPGPLTLRQRRRAALLRAGEQSMLSDRDALDLYGVPDLPSDPFVRVLVPNDVKRMSRDFLVIRRTTRMPPPRRVAGLFVAPPCRALADFVLRESDERTALAVASSAIQRGLVDLAGLIEEGARGPARGRPKLIRVLTKLERGVRSLPEADFRELVRRSRILPEPLWNCLLRLASGQLVSPDALWEDAGLVHETNGRKYHAPEDLFEDMQRRHDAMVTEDLVVLHNAPRRIGAETRNVLAEVETCYLRNKGRGLPPGVEIVRRGPAT